MRSCVSRVTAPGSSFRTLRTISRLRPSSWARFRSETSFFLEAIGPKFYSLNRRTSSGFSELAQLPELFVEFLLDHRQRDGDPRRDVRLARPLLVLDDD